MAVYLAPTFGAGYQAFGTDGLPLNGGFISTYAAGTATALATYTTSSGTVANPTSIVLGTDGRPPNEIWLTGATTYLFQLFTSSGVSIKSYDNLAGINDPASVGVTPSSLWAIAGGTVNAITAAYVPPNTALTDGLLLGIRTSGANTTTVPTFSPDGLTAHSVTKLGGAALVVPEWGANSEVLFRYNLPSTRWEYLTATKFKQPTFSSFTSATTTTYNPPTGCTRLLVELVGGGSGGCGGNGGGTSSSGSASVFSDGTVVLTANGGAAQVNTGNPLPAQATGSGGDVNISGALGTQGSAVNASGNTIGGMGAASYFGGGGASQYNTTAAGAAANTGAGGGGGSASTVSGVSGSGGNAGAYVRKTITPVSSSYSVTVGNSGAGSAGVAAGNFAGGAGGTGIVIINEFYD